MKHINLRTWRWIVWVLAPAVPLHELTHAAVGERVGADVTVDWTAPSVTMDWPAEPNALAVLAAHLAPLLIGYVLAPAVVVGLALGVRSGFSVGVLMWVAINWLYFSFPTGQDLSVVGPVANAIRAA